MEVVAVDMVVTKVESVTKVIVMAGSCAVAGSKKDSLRNHMFLLVLVELVLIFRYIWF